jgi:rRNA maturation protein Rpf1
MTKIVLYLLSIDIKEGIEYIVSSSILELKPPIANNDTTRSVKENLYELSSSIINANPDWLKYKIVNVLNKEGITELWYFARIPHEYKYMINKNYHTIKLSTSEDNDVLRLKYYL